MFIKRQDSNVLSEWENIPENREKALSWGYEIYDGEAEKGYDGEWYVKGTSPTAATETYAEKRRKEYPSVEDQLDMIYWDKINHSDNWAENISAIKAKYPKP